MLIKSQAGDAIVNADHMTALYTLPHLKRSKRIAFSTNDGRDEFILAKYSTRKKLYEVFDKLSDALLRGDAAFVLPPDDAKEIEEAETAERGDETDDKRKI